MSESSIFNYTDWTLYMYQNKTLLVICSIQIFTGWVGHMVLPLCIIIVLVAAFPSPSRTATKYPQLFILSSQTCVLKVWKLAWNQILRRLFDFLTLSYRYKVKCTMDPKTSTINSFHFYFMWVTVCPLKSKF